MDTEARPTVIFLPATQPPEGPSLWRYPITFARAGLLRGLLGWRRVLDAPPSQDALLGLQGPAIERFRVAAVGKPYLQGEGV